MQKPGWVRWLELLEEEERETWEKRRRAKDDLDERKASPPDVMAGVDEDIGEPDEDLPGAETWPDIGEVA